MLKLVFTTTIVVLLFLESVVLHGPYQTNDINPRLKRPNISSWQITYLYCNPSHWGIVYIETIFETQCTCTRCALSILLKHLLKQVIWCNAKINLGIKKSLWSCMHLCWNMDRNHRVGWNSREFIVNRFR